MIKRSSMLALLLVAALAIAAVGCGGGGSSEWSDAEVASFESEVDADTEYQLPQELIECIVGKVADEYPPSIVDEEDVSSYEDRFDEFAQECSGQEVDEEPEDWDELNDEQKEALEGLEEEGLYERE